MAQPLTTISNPLQIYNRDIIVQVPRIVASMELQIAGCDSSTSGEDVSGS